MEASTEASAESPMGETIKLGDLLKVVEDEREKERSQSIEKEKNFQPPTFSLDAERGLISAMMFDAVAVVEKAEDVGLKSADFYLPYCREMWKAGISLVRKERPVDAVTIVEELNRKATLSIVGGPGAISQLSTIIVAPTMAAAYCEIIVEQSRIRSLSVSLANASFEAKSGGKNSMEIIDTARREMSEIEIRGGDIEFDILQTTKTVLQSLEALGGKRETMPTGFIDVDSMIGGFAGGDLVIVAGRPSMGKTCWALDVARHVGLKEDKNVLIFSLEMTSEQLTERLIGGEARVSTKKARFSTSERDAVMSAAGSIGDSKIIIDDTAGLSVSEIRSRARKIHNKNPLGMVVIDYIQLLASERKLDNRSGEMAETSNALKRLARELRIPVVAMSQLNRGTESRLDKRPLMSDLRESGAIEQDADIVALLYREEYYGGDKTPDASKGIAELMISKNRNGPTGKVKLKFTAEVPRFDNLAKEDAHE